MKSKLPFFIHPDDAPSKQAVLKAALHLFVKNGLCETSIRAIADEAGYSNPVIFKFFESKEAMATYLFALCYQRFAMALVAAQRTDERADVNLRYAIARCCELIDESPEAFLYMQDNMRLLWPTMPSAVRQVSMIGQLRALVDACKDSDTDSTDLDTGIIVAGITGLFAQFSRLLYFGEFQGGAQTWQPQLLRAAEALLHG